MKRRLAVTALALVLATLAAPAAAATLPPRPGSPAESFDLDAVHVDRYGERGDAVVFIPGLGAGPWEWYGAIAHLASAHRVYAFTLPGFDGRPAPESPGHTIATTERALLDLIARDHLRRPVVVGHDLGSTIALSFAIDHPAMPRAVVAVDGTPISPSFASVPPNERKAQADSAAASETNDPTMVRDMALQNVATTGAVDRAVTDAILDRQGSADATTLALDLREMLLTDLRPHLGEIVAPLLVLVPYYLPDNSTPPSVTPPVVFRRERKVAAYRDLFAGAKTATFVPISPARHFLMLDAPAAFDAALDAFLAAHP